LEVMGGWEKNLIMRKCIIFLFTRNYWGDKIKEGVWHAWER
jgi:hypothetical protein